MTVSQGDQRVIPIRSFRTRSIDPAGETTHIIPTHGYHGRRYMEKNFENRHHRHRFWDRFDLDRFTSPHSTRSSTNRFHRFGVADPAVDERRIVVQIALMSGVMLRLAISSGQQRTLPTKWWLRKAPRSRSTSIRVATLMARGAARNSDAYGQF